MAKIDFNSYNSYQSGGTSNFPRVNFFSLADDGDEAIVRFPYSDPSEFDLDAVHTVKVGNAFKKVSCLRNAREPLEMCPFCANGGESQSKVSLRFFCKLVRYVQDDTGKIIAQACVWDRPAALSKTLASYIEDYGDLKNILFKIKRHGAKGSQSTTYDIVPAPTHIYKAELYPVDFSGFDKFDLSYFFCLKKTAEEMNTYLATGAFPEKAKTNSPVGSAFTPAASTLPFEEDYTMPTTGTPAVQATWTSADGMNTPQTTVAQSEAPRPRRYAV